jgi:hypothetical protein
MAKSRGDRRRRRIGGRHSRTRHTIGGPAGAFGAPARQSRTERSPQQGLADGARTLDRVPGRRRYLETGEGFPSTAGVEEGQRTRLHLRLSLVDEAAQTPRHTAVCAARVSKPHPVRLHDQPGIDLARRAQRFRPRGAVRRVAAPPRGLGLAPPLRIHGGHDRRPRSTRRRQLRRGREASKQAERLRSGPACDRADQGKAFASPEEPQLGRGAQVREHALARKRGTALSQGCRDASLRGRASLARHLSVAQFGVLSNGMEGARAPARRAWQRK